jgi:hypothetical protein
LDLSSLPAGAIVTVMRMSAGMMAKPGRRVELLLKPGFPAAGSVPVEGALAPPGVGLLNGCPQGFGGLALVAAGQGIVECPDLPSN